MNYSQLIPPGYKQTEVGVIPEDWEVKRIAEFGEIITGATPRTDIATFWGEQYPWITPTDISFDRDMVASDRMITQEGLNSIRMLPANTVLVTCIASIGKNAILKKKGGCNQQINAVIPCVSYSAEFLYYLFELNSQYLLANAGTTATSIISKATFSGLAFAVPQPAEQYAIATVLFDADALIESLEHLLTKKRQIKKGAMQELLTGKKRLPGFSGDWEIKRLGQLGGFLKGRGVTRDESATGNLACVRYGELYTRHNDHIETYYSWISREVATTATRLEHGDILFAGSGETKDEIGKCAAFVDNIEAYAGGDIVILRNRKADSLFLGYYLNTEPVNRQKASKGQGDAVVHINAAALADIQCAFPCVAEQTAIATILSDMDTEISALEAKLAKARQLKQGMMQELLTGRIRLL